MVQWVLSRVVGWWLGSSGRFGVGLSAADRILLEGVEIGLERLQMGAHEVEVEILDGLDACKGFVEVDLEDERELIAAFERVEELRVATRELRERAAQLSGSV